MTLMLNPDTEAWLRTVAAQRGLPPEKTIDVLLAEADTDFQKAVAGIQRGMEDFAAGRWISLEEYEAQLPARRQARLARVEAELVAELRASVEDHAAGRSMTLEELRVKVLARRAKRNADLAAVTAEASEHC